MKLHTNHTAAMHLISDINKIEEKLKSMKAHVDPESGVVTDLLHTVKLYKGVEDDMIDLRIRLIQFM